MARPLVGTVDGGAEGVRPPEPPPPTLLPVTFLQNERNSAEVGKRKARGRQDLSGARAAFLPGETWTIISKP